MPHEASHTPASERDTEEMNYNKKMFIPDSKKRKYFLIVL